MCSGNGPSCASREQTPGHSQDDATVSASVYYYLWVIKSLFVRIYHGCNRYGFSNLTYPLESITLPEGSQWRNLIQKSSKGFTHGHSSGFSVLVPWSRPYIGPSHETLISRRLSVSKFSANQNGLFSWWVLFPADPTSVEARAQRWPQRWTINLEIIL